MSWLMAFWAILVIYSLLAYVLQLMLLRGCSRPLIYVLQHASQSLMFAYCMAMVYNTQYRFRTHPRK